MAVSAGDVLTSVEAEEAAALSTVEVQRPFESQIDEGNMLLREENALPDLSKDKEDVLKALARDNMQVSLLQFFRVDIIQFLNLFPFLNF